MVKKLSVHFLAGAWTNERGLAGFEQNTFFLDDRFVLHLSGFHAIFFLKPSLTQSPDSLGNFCFT